MFDETLVYLIRDARLKGDEELVEQTYGILAERILLLVRKHSFGIPQHRFEEGVQELHFRIADKILDLESNRGDFAQVMFGLFVKTEAATIFKRIRKEEWKGPAMVEIDDANEDGLAFDLEDPGLSPEMFAEVRNCLSRIPNEDWARALRLRIAGWQIESQDPNVPTIAGLFGVTAHTINNWLNNARIVLRECLGGANG